MDNKRISIKIEINSHGEWENSLSLEGDYCTLIHEIDRFYKNVNKSIENVLERERIYKGD